MECTPPRENERRFRREAIVNFGILTALTILFVAIGLRRAESFSREAVITEGICRQLLRNTTEGRQALVGSVWWPPLPVLLRLPLVAVFADSRLPIASLFVGALFGAATLVALARELREWGFGRVRHLLIAALVLNPDYVKASTNGSSAPILFLFMLLSATSLARWMALHKLRSLVWLAFAAAGMILACSEVAFWLVILFLLLGFHARVSGWKKEQQTATLILALIPVAYVVALWFLMNWLIMGDSLYFVRSILPGGSIRHLEAGNLAEVKAQGMAWPILSALCLLLGGIRKERCTVYLGLLAIAPLAIATFLLSRGLTWNLHTVLACMCPLAIITLACLVRPGHGAVHQRWTVLASMIPLIIIAQNWGQRLACSEHSPEHAEFASIVAERGEILPRFSAHVRARTRYGRVFVAGYESFALLGPDADDIFVHSLDFDFAKAREAYHGQNLFLLVHKPNGRGATDSIHWKFRDIYSFGHESTLFDGDWGDWRLFEIIQAPAYRGR